MPKKGKKGGKKGGGKKTKKSKENELTPAEAILTYKINLKEQDLEELSFQMKELQDMKERNIERNERLSEERQAYISVLMKKIHEVSDQESENFTDRPEVINTMKENWNLERLEQDAIGSLKDDIEITERDIQETRKEIEFWKNYRDDGSKQQKTTMKLLQQEIRDSHDTFQSMCEYLDRKQTKDKTMISEMTNKAIEKHKSKATRHAINQLDKNSKQELVDNEWLKSEAQIHRQEVDRILAEVEEFEKSNLQIMSSLFDCRVQDLKFTQNFFMTQFKEDEDLEAGILEIDLDDVLQEKQTSRRKSRPKSAVFQAVEDKFAKLTEGFDSEEEHEPEDANISVNREPWEQYLEESSEPFMSLGPLEVKMLSVTGAKVRLNTPMLPSTEEVEAKQWNPDVWPVNHQMLKQVNHVA